MSEKSQAISFRLSDEHVRRLKILIKSQGCSMGDFARMLVLDQLDEDETNRQNINAMKEDLSMLNQKVSELRTLLAIATEGLLVGCSSGKPVSVEDAKNWVGKRFSKS